MMAGGAYLALVQKKKTEGVLTELKFMKSIPLAEVEATWRSLEAEGLGSGYRDFVETNGRAVTDGEVLSPYGDQPCAYYEATVTREYEKEDSYTDKEGRLKRRRTRSSEVVSSQKSSSPLYVADGDIRLGIDLDGATLHLKDGGDRFEPYVDNKSYSFFGASFSVPSGVRTIGFRYKEKIIPLDHPLYVVGEARGSAGTLRIGRPTEKDKPFIVSVKSEEEVAAGQAGKIKGVFYLGVGLIIAGAAVVLLLK